jgi:hypothetical protein
MRIAGWRFPYRHLGSALLGMFVVGSILLGELAPPTAEQQYARTSALAAADLTDDDAGQALFTTGQLLPGSVVTNCLFVEYAGPLTVGKVRLGVDNVAGPLAHKLTIKIEQGVGGRFGDCAGFTGAPIYDGPLAELSAAPAAPAAASAAPAPPAAIVPSTPGVETGWTPRSGEGRTYQITVTVAANVAQGLSCTATFRWELVDETPDASTAPAVPTPTPTAPKPDSAPQSGWTSAVEAAKALGGGVVKVAKLTARHSGLVGGWLVVIVLFMAVQNRIDARDPKLALAPLVPEPYLYFTESDPDAALP